MKKTFRDKGQAILLSFDSSKKEEIEHSFLKTLFSSSLWKESQCIGVTLSNSLEWQTRGIIQKAWQEKKQVCVPKTIPSLKQMAFYELTGYAQIEPGHFGMDEPVPSKTQKITKEEIDLLFVPGLMYNQKGYRVGFGGGYYDRFLMDFPGETIAMLHTKQLDASLPVENHDIPVSYLLTEKGFLSVPKKDRFNIN